MISWILLIFLKNSLIRLTTGFGTSRLFSFPLLLPRPVTKDMADNAQPNKSYSKKAYQVIGDVKPVFWR
jgi:hypothetical protein